MKIEKLYSKKYTYIIMHIIATLMANGIFQLLKQRKMEKKYLKISKMSEFLRLMNELPNDVKEKIIKLTEEQEKKVK